jgi:two-component system NtrC family sensor kinase
MRTNTEIQHLLKAVDAFKRRILVISPDFKILATNRPPGTYSDKDPIGKFCYQVFHSRTSPCDNCAVEKAAKNHTPSLCPKLYPLENSDLVPCFYAYPIYYGNEIEAYVSMDFDIPGLDILEEKLRRSNAFLQDLLLSAVDCVVAADISGKIFLFNESSTEVFGYTEAEALHEITVRDIYPENIAYQVMKDLRGDDYGGKGRLKTYHVNVLAKNGEHIPISLYAHIIYKNGEEAATIGFFHDLRERLKIRKELENTQVQLLQAEKMGSLGKLAAGVAHQLNNPLGGITLFAKLMMEEYDLPENAKKDLNRILKDAERCRDIVKELLEFTRQTRHLIQLNDINKLLNRTLFLLENQALFQNITVQKDLLDDLPPVSSDAQQLNHLFMNIILNAAQAMDGKGTLTLQTTTLHERVRIQIADSGPGIPEQSLPYIFEPFFTTKEEGKGTGLGLSLAYNIVESHGGRISATNNPDQGATFVIDLPVDQKYDQGEDVGE